MVQEMALLSTQIDGLKLTARGKVRDIYEVDDKSLLFVATDRLSAFDVIMKNVRSLTVKCQNLGVTLQYDICNREFQEKAKSWRKWVHSGFRI